jgi:hypothetical protein
MNGVTKKIKTENGAAAVLNSHSKENGAAHAKENGAAVHAKENGFPKKEVSSPLLSAALNLSNGVYTENAEKKEKKKKKKKVSETPENTKGNNTTAAVDENGVNGHSELASSAISLFPVKHTATLKKESSSNPSSPLPSTALSLSNGVHNESIKKKEKKKKKKVSETPENTKNNNTTAVDENGVNGHSEVSPISLFPVKHTATPKENTHSAQHTDSAKVTTVTADKQETPQKSVEISLKSSTSSLPTSSSSNTLNRSTEDSGKESEDSDESKSTITAKGASQNNNKRKLESTSVEESNVSDKKQRFEVVKTLRAMNSAAHQYGTNGNIYFDAMIGFVNNCMQWVHGMIWTIKIRMKPHKKRCLMN